MMKKPLCFVLAMLLLFPALGCQRIEHKNSCTFYYPRIDYGYNTQEDKFYNSIIRSELREDISDHAAENVIGIYLKGPINEMLANPFPEKLSLIEASIDGQTLYITVTDHLSELTGIKLMIACACLARTGMELTNASTVQISCKTALLDGKKSIVLNADTIIFEDTVTAATEEQE